MLSTYFLDLSTKLALRTTRLHPLLARSVSLCHIILICRVYTL